VFNSKIDASRLKEVIIELAEIEKNQFIEDSIRLNYTDDERKKYEEQYNRSILNVKNNPLRKIVIHGLNQFTPAQLRLIIELDKLGIEIIFLYNYQKKYSKIYESWDNIYKCFGIPILHDKEVGEYNPGTEVNASHSLALALGEISQGRINTNDKRFSEWYKKYKAHNIIEFDNITEFTGYVSSNYDEAVRLIRDENLRSGLNVDDHEIKALRKMTEFIYSANSGVDDLIKINYSGLSKDRHFLAYPIGQFFSSIYKLWDWEKNEIFLDNNGLRECLTAGILNTAPSARLLKEFYVLSYICEKIDTYSEFKSVMDNYLNIFNEISHLVVEPDRHFSKMAIYNKTKITIEEIKEFISAIDEINNIAKGLFKTDGSNKEYINFGKHFERLGAFMKERKSSLINYEEKLLLDELIERLDQIKPEDSENGTIEDLKKGIYFYLKQKNESQPEWIIKNFEQIDGDVLRSRKQSQQNDAKVYHLACVSDHDMNRPMNELLPWPLTEQFIRRAYSPIDLQFQVYYSALSERNNFMKYAFFYGLFFNESDILLSYIKRYKDEITEPYYLLSLLGLKKQISNKRSSIEYNLSNPTMVREEIASYSPTHIAVMDMLLCPFRYVINDVINDGTIINNEFLYQKLYENILEARVGKKVSNALLTTIGDKLDSIIESESKEIKRYFPFWLDVTFIDLEKRCKNYLLNTENVKKYKRFPQYDENHTLIRLNFGKALFTQPIDEYKAHDIKSFSKVITQSESEKVYSLHKINQTDIHSYTKEMSSFLGSEINPEKNLGDWCTYCNTKDKCLKPYMADENHSIINYEV
jgi:hypothetical protein